MSRRFRDQTFSLFRFNLMSYGVRLVTSAIVARMLGPEMMGLWILLSMFPTWADGFARLKVDVAAVYVLGQGRGSFAEVSGAIHLIAIATGGGVALALLAAEPWVLPAVFGDGVVSPWAYRLVLVSIPINFVAINYGYLMLQLEDVDGYNRAGFVRGVLPSLLATVLLLVTPLRVGALVAGVAAGAVAGVLYGLYRLRERPQPAWPRQPGLWQELFGYSSRLYAGGLVEYCNQYVSAVLLGLKLRPADLTFYRMGQDRLQLLDQVPSALNTVLYPRIANSQESAGRNALVAMSCRVLVLLLGAGSLVGAVLAPAIVFVMYGAAYAPMVDSIWLLLPGVVAVGATQPVMQFLAGTGRADLSWKLPLVPLAMQVVLSVPLMNTYGFRGAAVAFSLACVALAIARVWVWSVVTGEPRRRLVQVGRPDVVLVWGFVMDGWRSARLRVRRA